MQGQHCLCQMGHSRPLGSSFPGPLVELLTINCFVCHQAPPPCRAWGSSQVGGLSLSLSPVSLSYFHACIAVLIRNHISYPRAFLQRFCLTNPSLRMAGLMKGPWVSGERPEELGNRTQARASSSLVLISGSDMLLSSQLVFNSVIRI